MSPSDWGYVWFFSDSWSQVLARGVLDNPLLAMGESTSRLKKLGALIHRFRRGFSSYEKC
jgi:hypothetical protein